MMHMGKEILPYKDSDLNKKEQVRQMFDTISGNYDGLNRLITFGADIRWRKRLIRRVSDRSPESILDIDELSSFEVAEKFEVFGKEFDYRKPINWHFRLPMPAGSFWRLESRDFMPRWTSPTAMPCITPNTPLP